MDTIDEFLDRIDSLPPAPQVLPQLLTTLAEANTDVSRVVDLIAFDPALTAKLLATCNSAFFGKSTPVDDVSEAVNRLGFQTVYRIVAAVRGGNCFRASEGTTSNSGELWRHCVTVAFAAQFVAEDIGADSGLLFTAGMLHDLGKVILAQAYKEDYARLVIETSRLGRTLFEQEKASYGVDHAEVCGRLLERWKFSPPLVASVRFHHDPSAAGEARRLAACVNLADTLAHSSAQDQAIS